MEKLYLNELNLIKQSVLEHELNIEVALEHCPDYKSALSDALIDSLQSLVNKIERVIESNSKRIEIVR